MSELAEWDNFYVIVGSVAGALIGLQFVVLTLIAERPPAHAEDGTASFATPTVVHFGVVVFLSAALSAPWHSILPVAMLWGLVGLSGIAYSYIVLRRMGRQAAYKPEFEDWFFHAVLPIAGYATIAAMALVAPTHPRAALFGVGSAALLLLFIGIHNAWDGVVYYAVIKRPATKTDRH
jgi:hypothetical protein